MKTFTQITKCFQDLHKLLGGIHLGKEGKKNNFFFKKRILEDISPFLSGHGYPCFGLLVMSALGFKGGSPNLYSSLPVHNRILRFTSGGTPADLLAAIMAAKPFTSTYLQTSIGGAQDQDLSCMWLPHTVKPDRCSTD